MFGVTEEKAKQMVEDGVVKFKDVEQAFGNMTSAGGLFEDMMVKQSETVAGKWSNLKDTLTLFAESLGSSMLPAMNSFIS